MTSVLPIRQHWLDVQHACELAGSDHNPWPLPRQCIECGLADPCPTKTLAMEVKEHAVAALAQLDAAPWASVVPCRLVPDPETTHE